MADPQYKRLTRSKQRSAMAVAVMTRSSLWLGPDHLLLIDTNGYQETYKRFYFRDIQALTVALNRRRLVWNCILGALTVICASLWAWYFSANPAEWAPLGLALGTTALFGIPLVLNNLLGPTCTCELRTAVQTERLCSLNRLRQTRRVLGQLRPLILTVQKPAAQTETMVQSSSAPSELEPLVGTAESAPPTQI